MSPQPSEKDSGCCKPCCSRAPSRLYITFLKGIAITPYLSCKFWIFEDLILVMNMCTKVQAQMKNNLPINEITVLFFFQELACFIIRLDRGWMILNPDSF